MEKLEMKVVRPFGPSVVHAKIPVDTIEILNKYIDGIVTDKKKLSDLDHGHQLVGDVTQEFILEPNIIEKSGFGKFLTTCVNRWVEWEFKRKITKFNIKTSWVVRQFQNEYNPTHWHNGHISGAGFLKVPSTFGKHIQKKNKDYHGGSLQLINGTRHFMSPSTVSLTPKVGDFYFFPNYLMHTVFPFKDTKEERRSISFNAEIDDTIYDAYS
tara:strand:- start:154 stop:789 length:636 start_codon:yes stop_codon:yes gene_type:complete